MPRSTGSIPTPTSCGSSSWPFFRSSEDSRPCTWRRGADGGGPPQRRVRTRARAAEAAPTLALRLSAVAAHAITVWTFLVVPLTRSGLAPIVSLAGLVAVSFGLTKILGSRGTAAGSGIPRGGLPDSAVHPARRAEPDVLARGGAGGNRASDPRPSGWRIEAGNRPPAASPSPVGSPAGQRDRVRGGRRDPRADAGGRVRGRAPPAAGVGVPEGRASLSRHRAGARPRQRRPAPRRRSCGSSATTIGG